MIRRFRRRRRRAVAAVLSTGVLALVAPTAVGATSDDLRSPDARDAAVAAQQQAQSEVGHSDLRSPDARDAALGTTTGSDPAPVATPTVITVEERGSQTLAIVFSVIALVIALLAIGFTALARRPRPRWSAP